jgi:hypothetical protein
MVAVVSGYFARRALAPARSLPVRGLFVFDGLCSAGARQPRSRVVDLGDDTDRLRWARRGGISKLQELSALDRLSQGDIFAMTYSLRHRRPALSAPTQAPIRSRASDAPEDRGSAMKSTRDVKDELALEVPTLEAEVLGLRQLLAEVKANRDELRQEMDDLRRDRDHWRKLAEQAGPTLSGAGRRTWFCGRASSGD